MPISSLTSLKKLWAFHLPISQKNTNRHDKIEFKAETICLTLIKHVCYYKIKMLFATAKSYLTSYLFLLTYYFPKNPAILGKSEEVRVKK